MCVVVSVLLPTPGFRVVFVPELVEALDDTTTAGPSLQQRRRELADFAFFSAPSPRPDPPLPAGQSLLLPSPSPVAFPVGRAARRWAQDGASQKEGLSFPWVLIQSSKHRWTQPPSSTQATLSKVTASPWCSLSPAPQHEAAAGTVPQLLLLEPLSTGTTCTTLWCHVSHKGQGRGLSPGQDLL